MRNPRFEVVNDERLLKSRIDGPENRSGIYLRGNASTIEEHLGLSGLEILYVGDHLYTDVLLSKDILRRRTALLVRELEDELKANTNCATEQQSLNRPMNKKERLEFEQSQVRIQLQ
jgi:5'-nucleotidase